MLTLTSYDGLLKDSALSQLIFFYFSVGPLEPRKLNP
jgi:hypothetical protein